jgi:hypothetical protein
MDDVAVDSRLCRRSCDGIQDWRWSGLECGCCRGSSA